MAVSASATRRESDAFPDELPSADLTSNEAGSATIDALVTVDDDDVCTRALEARLLDWSTGTPRIAAVKEAACIVKAPGMVQYDNVLRK